ncbi:amidohydrolase, partial [bacterium]
EIPFKVHVRQAVTEALRFKQNVAPEKFDVRMLRNVTTSPDGKSVTYCALGRLWTKALPDGQPKRLTNEDNFEFSPSFSPDGKWIAYVTWTDSEKGAVRKVKVSGGMSIQLTQRKGTYLEPSFSRDGTKIVFRRLGGDLLRGQAYGDEPGIYIMPAAGGDATLVTEEGIRPRFNRTGERIFLESSEGEKTALVSVDLSGSHRQVHLLSDNAQMIVPSPDERWVAFTERFNSYVATLPLTGQPVQIGPGTSDFPVKRITRDAGMYLHWSPDSKTVYWSLGPELFSRTLSKTFAFAGNAKDTVLERPDTSGIFIGFQSKSDTPEGKVVLTGATVITMKGDEVVKDATIVVDRNRIAAIGPKGSVTVPRGAKVVDVAGRYIMPGIIDVHAHGPAGSSGIIPEQNWAFYATLAYGVTTEHDPSNDTEQIFSASEMQKAGLITGPRLFSTGTILYGAEGNFKAIVNNIDDARSHLRRLKAVGAFSVKSYNQPRRDQRQQIIDAARELNMMVVPEGGSTYFWNMSQLRKGQPANEHSLPVAPLYKDVVTLFARSHVGYTPTLIVSYGGLWGENYWYANTHVWENTRLLTYIPRSVIDARSRRRIVANDDDWNFINNAKAAKKILDAGGKVQLGAHGQLQGLGAHWELWMLVHGGMTPMDALRCATLYGAEYHGLDGDIGSLEPGKLADLIVMEKSPLENIRNSDSIQYVMLNGRLYDAATMNQVGDRPVKRSPFYWEGGRDPGSTEEMMDLD